MFNDLSDGGIVLLAQYSGDTPTTFKTIGANGQPGIDGVVQNLTNANYIASRWFSVGQWQNLQITIGGNITAGTASIDVVLERRRKDAVNGGTFAPSVMTTVRTDAPAAGPATSQTISTTDLAPGTPITIADWDGSAAGGTPTSETSRSVLLQTTDGMLAGEMRVLIKAANAARAGDIVYVAVNRG